LFTVNGKTPQLTHSNSMQPQTESKQPTQSASKHPVMQRLINNSDLLPMNIPEYSLLAY